MLRSLGLIFLLSVSVGLGYSLTRSRDARKYGVIAVATLLAIPVLLFILANAVDSETLAWVAGLSMMAMLACTSFVGLGALVGWWMARRSPAAIALTQPITRPTTIATRPATDKRRALSPEQRRMLVAVAAAPASLWVVITIGFWINEPVVPGALAIGFLPALIVVIVAIATALRYAWTTCTLPSFSFQSAIRDAQSRSQRAAEHETWLASMQHDPKRRRYFEMIQAGDPYWTPERVEYDLDPSTTICRHLLPIESAMRADGIAVRWDGPTWVRANCRIDIAALERRFSLPAHVNYQELMMYDERGADDPQARVACTECEMSPIWVRHPQRADADTPLFPGAPH